MSVPRLVLAGIPQHLVDKLSRQRRTNRDQWKALHKPKIEGWEVVLVVGRLTDKWADVLDLADDRSHDGAHILAYYPANSPQARMQREALRARINNHHHHRFIWLTDDDIATYGTTEFADRIVRLAQFERSWRDALRPITPDSPLLLPGCTSFVAAPKVDALWARAQRAEGTRDGVTEIEAIRRLIKDFRKAHYKKDDDDPQPYWKDEREIRFRRAEGGQLHGRAPASREWKYTAPIRVGFHYDVHPARPGKFTVSDFLGDSHKFTGHANVDCHGYVYGRTNRYSQ